jgi:DNA-binding Lrp family transcriptional regulator
MICGESAENSMQALDDTDRTILRLLRADGRMSNADLAEAVGLSASACLRRVRLLEHRGIIRGYTALIEEAAPRDLVVVIVQITLDRQTDDHLKRFEEAVRRCAEVRECYLMTGIADYLLRVEARDAADYERIHKEALSRMPGVARIQSSFAIRTVIRGTA